MFCDFRFPYFRISGDFRGHDTYFPIFARSWGVLFRNKFMSPEILPAPESPDPPLGWRCQSRRGSPVGQTIWGISGVFPGIDFRGHDTYFPILARSLGGLFRNKFMSPEILARSLGALFRNKFMSPEIRPGPPNPVIRPWGGVASQGGAHPWGRPFGHFRAFPGAFPGGHFRGHDTYFPILARSWGWLFRNKFMSPRNPHFPILARG